MGSFRHQSLKINQKLPVFVDIGRFVLIEPDRLIIMTYGSRHIDGRTGAFYMAQVAEAASVKPESDFEKVTVRLTGTALSQVKKLAADQGISVNEFMRRAVSTEAYILSEIQSGSKILIEDSSSRQRQIVFR